MKGPSDKNICRTDSSVSLVGPISPSINGLLTWPLILKKFSKRQCFTMSNKTHRSFDPGKKDFFGFGAIVTYTSKNNGK